MRPLGRGAQSNIDQTHRHCWQHFSQLPVLTWEAADRLKSARCCAGSCSHSSTVDSAPSATSASVMALTLSLLKSPPAMQIATLGRPVRPPKQLNHEQVRCILQSTLALLAACMLELPRMRNAIIDACRLAAGACKALDLISLISQHACMRRFRCHL